MINWWTYYIWLWVCSFLKYRLKRRFTAAGLLVISSAVIAAVFGLDTNKTLSYQIFTLLTSLLVLAFLTILFFRARITVHRSLPVMGTAGQPLPYRIRVVNEGKRGLRGLSYSEMFPDPRPSFRDFLRGRKAISKDFNWYSSRSGTHAWDRLVQQKKMAASELRPLPDLGAGRTADISATIMPLRRGRLTFNAMLFTRPDPFGLVRSFLKAPSVQSIIISPKRYPVPDLDLPGTRAYQHGGVALSTSVADSEEFQSLREYRAGDPLRLIHWKSWARVGKPVIKEFQDEFFVRHALVLDTFVHSVQDRIFEEAVSVAASFASTVQTQESLLDLLFVGTEAFCETIGRGQGQIQHLLKVLACVQPCDDHSFPVLSSLVLSRRALMSGCICVFSSWDRERYDLVHGLTGLGVRPKVFLITDGKRSNISTEMDLAEKPAWLHLLEAGKIQEGLAKI